MKSSILSLPTLDLTVKPQLELNPFAVLFGYR